ncbi:flagellin N-terminal helical domain-containing protein [Clostridium lacusfryxellense]|uniref:flagellin N-terminal helical domain-containing protein n=1 Tax=Clostridium lacusfryxellense TaxID=205328 RepID=UPI001FE3866B|nr:flagellin [Clostridium lacusfryxellense]
MIINTNLAAMNANRHMNINNTKGRKSMEQLSSGKRINKAADDSAGLSISEKMKGQIRGLQQASLNTEQGIDLIKTSDGAMGEIHSTLQRMRELSVQASSETITNEDRKSIQVEISELSKQVDSVSKTTEFNTIRTIDGSLRNIPPTTALEAGKSVSSPISIHDDTSANVMSSSVVDFDNGIEIHSGKQAITDLTLNSPFNIISPNNKLNLTYVDENNITYTKDLNLDNTSTGTIEELVGSVQNAINNDTDLKDKISVTFSTNPDKISLISSSLEPNSKVGIFINSSSAANEIAGTTSTMSGMLMNPISISAGSSLKLVYTDSNGITDSQTLSLDLYDSESTASHPIDLAIMIQCKINSPIDTKVSVSIDSNGMLKLESEDKGYFSQVNIIQDAINPWDVYTTIFKSKNVQNGSLNINTKLGVTRNDQLKFTFNDKTVAASTKFDDDNGFTVSDPQWSQKTFLINITDQIYTTASDFCNQINNAISVAGYADKVNANYDHGYYPLSNNRQIGFTTVNEGENATLKLQDVNSAKGSNMFSIVKLNSATSKGQDKTDTFAIEVNARYTEKEVDDVDLSVDDIQKLLNNKTVYTSNGYIIQDPLNPYDFIQYTKVQGTGETKQITLQTENYTKDEFVKILQDAINDSTDQLGNDVIVTVDGKTGGLNIGTPQQDGSKSSVRFVVPANASNPGNQSPINTSMDELLNNFLSATGFDYNRHVGKDGTGKMDIQVGANSNQNILIKIGSIRAGALRIKYLDVTTSQKASDAITILDEAINKVSSERTSIGAFQNSFEHVVSNLQNTSTNLTAAQSRIEDVDMAEAMSTFSKNNILTQAAQAMQVQANQQPQQVLALLK